MYIFGSGTVKKALANAAITAEAIVVSVGVVVSTSNGPFQQNGLLGGFAGLTIGAIYFLSATTAGAITSVAPTTLGQYVVQIGRALSATQLLIDIRPPILL